MSLPANWLHEVSSSGRDGERGHLSVNFWFDVPGDIDERTWRWNVSVRAERDRREAFDAGDEARQAEVDARAAAWRAKAEALVANAREL